MVGCGEHSLYIQSINEAARQCDVTVEQVDGKEFKKQYPYFRFPEEVRAVLEKQNAGYINPRKLVKAQITIATRNGCTFMDDTVSRVDRVLHDDGCTYVMKVVTETGSTMLAKSVLLATGAFTNSRAVLPSGLVVNQTLMALTVAYLEVSMDERLNKSLRYSIVCSDIIELNLLLKQI